MAHVHRGYIVGLAWLQQRLDPYGMALWPSALVSGSAKVVRAVEEQARDFCLSFMLGKHGKKTNKMSLHHLAGTGVGVELN